MKKILAVFAVLLTLFLVSCGSSRKIDYLVVSTNKIVYSDANNDVSEAGTPKIDQNADFNIYAVYTDSTVEAITTAFTFETRRIEIIDQNNAIFEVTVRAQGLTTTYEVYATDNTLTSGAAVVGAMHITSTDVSEVSNALTTVLANDYDSSLIKLLVATEDGEELNVEPVVDEANYNIMKHGKQELRLKYEDLSLPFTVKVFKPGNDNAIPIRTEYANFWDWVFIIPVAFIMQLFSGLLFNSFAFGILMATIIIRTLAWPIYARSNDLSLRMAVAQPDLNRIQQKYATRQDPVSKQKMQLEIMQVYKKHRISILGCFTPLLQMPLFLAVYQTVHRITVPGGMYADRVTNTTFLWMDLSVGS